MSSVTIKKSTTAPVTTAMPVARKVWGAWVIDGVTLGCYPNQARALGTTQAHMGDLVPFETKRKAQAAWLAIHNAPKAFAVGQEVWLCKTTPARVLACTYSGVVVLYSDNGIAVKVKVLLSKVTAREREVA